MPAAVKLLRGIRYGVGEAKDKMGVQNPNIVFKILERRK